MRMCKRFTAILLALLLFALPVAAAPQTGEDADLTISDVQEFLTFAEKCRLDSYSQNLTVSLEADIDLSGTQFEPIPIFSGIFLGNGHTVSGLTLTDDGSVQGLFRYITSQATVQGLNVRGTVQPKGSRSTVGGIAGSNAGLIRNCTFEGTVSASNNVGGIAGENTLTGTIENCTTRGDIHGFHFVGGIAGDNPGVIRGCSNFAAVNTTAEQNQVDLSDITLDSLTNSESSFSSTDIGGIAGISSGVIRSCENRGSVGYHLMGYNVGGIAGTQSGYITGCENHGKVLGRKEVGGIVGQMEPAAAILYSEDTLQTLDGQLETLSGLVDRAYYRTQSNLGQIESQLALLLDQAQTASNAVDTLTPDPNNGKLPDTDTVTAAVSALSDSLTAMSGTIRSIITSIEDTSSTLRSDLQAVVDQVGLISRTAGSAEETLGGSLGDVSDRDTDDDLTGKVSNCVNTGSVLADLNAGGITGAMAVETDLDVLEDWESEGHTSLHFESNLRAVILNCENRADISVNKQNAGGIAGWQSLGLVKQCVNAGDVQAVKAEYVGGISGMSRGFIRNSHAKCRLSGISYVGGIAGSATVVTDCYSVVLIEDAREQTGAVLGAFETPASDEETPVSGNFYLLTSDDPGAVDGISYDGQAQPLSLDELTSLEQFPAQFKQAKVTFLMPNGSEKTFPISLGSSLDPQLIPDLPKKDGQSAYWDGLESSCLENLLFDLSFESTYNAPVGVIESTQKRNGLPVLLLEGAFLSDPAVTTASCADLPTLPKGSELLDCLEFSVTGYQELSTAHYLPSSDEESRLVLYVRSKDGQWQTRPFTREGRYLLFQLNDGDNAFALISAPPSLLPCLLIGGGALLVIAAIVTTVVIRRKKKAKQVKEPV